MNSKIYKVKEKTVGDCVKACTFRKDAWYIPDIQRSFVWSARQTLLLIDSLFKGWPFGVLTIETARASDGGSIPPRCFIEVNDLQKEPHERMTFPPQEDGLPDEYSLVLDGQQRLQSLALAFGSKKTKYIQNEERWYWELCGDRPRKAYGADYEMVAAMLSLDFDRCFKAYQDAEEIISEIKFVESGAICYTFLDAKTMSRHYQEDSYLPFPVLKLSGTHLRLSKLWLSLDQLSDRSEIGSECLPVEHYFDVDKEWRDWCLDSEWIKDGQHREFVQKLIVYLYERVYTQPVSYIELKRPDEIEHEEFQKKVVEIFTRLNKAGTQLEVSEVTAAWLKNAWKGTRSLDLVVSEFYRMFDGRGLEAPDFVRFISSLWALEDFQSKNRKVIQNKDLTNSVLLGELAKWFSAELKSIREDISDVCNELSNAQWMWNEIGSRAFVLAVLVAYRRRVRLNRPVGSEQAKALYDEKIGMVNIVRFMAISNWSGYWSTENLKAWSRLWAKAVADDDIYKFNIEFGALQKRLAQSATEALLSLSAGRCTVRRYFLYLQVWHRLTRERWDSWRSQMSHGVLDVDHCYAFARWETLLGKLSGQMTVDERAKIDPVVNQLGNCILLDRSKNIAKGKKAMQVFFVSISEPARKALLLTPNMVDDVDKKLTVKKLEEEITSRSESMKIELRDFIDGKCVCV